jgi:glucose-1-phosphate adenylyltransferase
LRWWRRSSSRQARRGDRGSAWPGRRGRCSRSRPRRSSSRPVGSVLRSSRAGHAADAGRSRAKPAVPFGGCYRIIDFTLSNCIHSRPAPHPHRLLTQYQARSLEEHIRFGWNFLPRRLEQFITAPAAPRRRQRGTAAPPTRSSTTSTRSRTGSARTRADPLGRSHLQDGLRPHAARAPGERCGAHHRCGAHPDRRGAPLRHPAGRRGRRRVPSFVEKPRPTRRDPRASRASASRRWASTCSRPRSWSAGSRTTPSRRRGSSHDFGKDIIPR